MAGIVEAEYQGFLQANFGHLSTPPPEVAGAIRATFYGGLLTGITLLSGRSVAECNAIRAELQEYAENLIRDAQLEESGN